MPELPEVETIVRDLDRLVRGRTIVEVAVLKPDLVKHADPEAFSRAVTGRAVRAVTRRAKNIVLDLGADRLVVNLGMTGRLLLHQPGAEEPSHVALRFPLDDGRELLYHDIRRFGSLEVLSAEAWREREERMGTEPLSDEFTTEHLYRRSRGSRVAIKTWLMDLRRVVGVGNIYASEALFRAGIDPRLPARRLTRAQAARLRDAIREVLQEAIEFRGTTFLDYRDATGERGGFADRLGVYDRAGQPCRVCATLIERIVQGGRSTFFCPVCQR